MPSGKYPEQVGSFQKWAQDQVKRGTVAGNKVSGSRNRTTRKRKKAYRRRKQDG